MTFSSIALATALAIGTSATALATLHPAKSPAIAYTPTDVTSLRNALDFEPTENGFLDVIIKNRIATIFGYAHAQDIDKARQAIQQVEGIDQVMVTAATIS